MPTKEDEKRRSIPKVMPNNLDAELSVLGSALLDEDACVGIVGKLSVKDFYSEVHQKIFGAIVALYNKNIVVDYVTLSDELEQRGELEAVGGDAFITSLTNVVPSAGRWSQYADIVKRCAVNRNLIRSCDMISNKAYCGDEDSLEVAEKNIYELSEKGQVSSLESVSQFLDPVMEKFREINKSGGETQGITSGFYAIDEVTRGWQNSDLIIVAARPAVGKTALSMNFIINAALKGKKCAVFSLEMSKAQLTQRMLCSVAGVDMGSALRGRLQPNDWTKLFDAMNKLKNCDIFIDDSTLNTPTQILTKCRKMKREKGLDLIMIDYLQLMYSDKRTENRQQEVSDISRRMKILAKELNVPVLLLSQLSRAVENRTGVNSKPQLSDLRETGAIEQDADIVMFIHKPKDVQGVEQADQPIDYNAEIIFAKHRSGKVGSVFIGWKGSRVSFVNLPKDQNAMSLMESAPKASKQIAQPEKVDVGDFNDMYLTTEESPFDDVEAPPFEDDMQGLTPPPQDPNGDIFD